MVDRRRPKAEDAVCDAKLCQGSAWDLLPFVHTASVDLVITDPPYASLEKHRARGTTTRLSHSKSSSNDWFEVMPNERFGELFAQVWRVLKPNRHFYLFVDFDTLRWLLAHPELFEQLEQRRGRWKGFTLWKPIVWDKETMGMGYHYRARCEFILFFEKGKRRLNDLGVPDVLSFKRVRNGYPTEKPVPLSEVLVRQSTEPGERVLDPFMGSGSVGVAAVQQGCHFEGFDLAPTAVDHAAARLEESSARVYRGP